MKKKLAALLFVLLLLTGCGTSQEVSSLDSLMDSQEWEDLLTPSPSQTPTPSPETDPGTPPLTKDENGEEAVEVTEDYKNIFLGTWDNESGTMVYEFKANENLIVTTNASGLEETFTYWFMDVGGQVRLNIFENGADAAVEYSFTKSGNSITLYDVDTGSALEVLIRRPTPTPTPSPTPTPTPTATPKPSTAPTPSPAVVPSASPAAAPSPSPSVVPSPEPSPVPGEVSPQPTENLDRPPVSDEPDTEEVELPQVAMNAMSAIECAMDVLADGTSFSASDPEAFWSIMARYISRMEGEKQSFEENETFLVTAETVESYAARVFADYTELPAVPEGHGLVTSAEGGYQIRYGEGGTMLDIKGYDTSKGALIAGYNGVIYEIAINGSSAITSITESNDPEAYQ